MPMPIRPGLVLSLAALPVPIYLYYQHQRLLREYPSHSIPLTLQMSRRTDRPLVGMNPPKVEEEWRQTAGGDMWQAFVPKRLLVSNLKAESRKEAKEKEMLDSFVKSYWRSWPLQLEKYLVTKATQLGVGPFSHRLLEAKVEQGSCQPGEKLIGGLFIAEARDVKTSPLATATATPSSDPTLPILGPLITSWRLSSPILDSPPSTPSTKTGALLGGYHTFAVQPLPALSTGDEEMVRLIFTSELCMDRETKGDLKRTTELEGLGGVQNAVMWFHHVYSRILLDQAVKGLKENKK